MFDHKHYVPILGGKLGEYAALKELPAATKDRITPLIEVPPVPWDFQNERLARTIDAHLSGTAAAIEDAWGGGAPIFVDLFTVEDDGPMASGDHPLVHVFTDGRGRGLELVPVTGLDRDGGYQNAVRDTIAIDGRGVCVRLMMPEIAEDPDFIADLDQLIADLRTSPSSVDLIIDAGPIPKDMQSAYAVMARGAIAMVPHIAQWRTLTIAGSAFPRDLSGFARDAVSLSPRTEWAIWRSLAARRERLARMPTFGDYAVDAPGHDQIDFRVIKMSASIRYCHDSDWVIVKGHAIHKGTSSQHPALASIMRARPEFCGVGFSWGDAFIDGCAGGSAGPGNATTWRQVGVNHHIQFVVNQIASYPGL